MRWVVLLALVVASAGCTMPTTTTTTTEEIYVGGERTRPAYPVPMPSPPAPFPLDQIPPPGRGGLIVLPHPTADPPSAPRAIEYNGGFEEGDALGATGWQTEGDARRDTAIVRTGNSSLFLGPGARTWQTIGGAQPSDHVWLRYHERLAPRADGQGGSVLRVSIVSLDAQRLVLDGRSANDSGGSSESWQDGNLGPFLFGNAASHLQLEISVEGGNGLYLDDVSLVLAKPNADTFMNGGFESGPTGWALTREAGVACGFSFAPEGNCTLRLDHAYGGAASQHLLPAGGSVALSFQYASQVVSWSDRWLFANLTFTDGSGEPTRAPYAFAARMVDPGWKTYATERIAIPTSTTVVALEIAVNTADPGPTWVDDVRVAWS